MICKRDPVDVVAQGITRMCIMDSADTEYWYHISELTHEFQPGLSMGCLRRQ